MPAFIDLAGIPMTANAALLKGWLRRRLGFGGVIVSDYNAIAELINHGIAADLAQAATLALKAGVDIDMMADAYRQGLPIALDRGWVSPADIDESVRRVLTLKWKLGLFDDPYRRGSVAESCDALQTRRRFARAVAARSLVMLKNDARAALSERHSRVAVIGPLADAAADMRGPWWGAAAPRAMSRWSPDLRAATVRGACPARGGGGHRGGRHRGRHGPSAGPLRSGRRGGLVSRRDGDDERRGGEPRSSRTFRGANASSRRPCSSAHGRCANRSR